MHFRLAHDGLLPEDGEPLLIALPGAGCSPAIYDGVRVPGWTVCAVDWATGPRPLDPVSIAERISALINVRRGPTVVAGHSMGAAVAVLVAALAPERVDGLVISNTGVNSRNHGDPTLITRIREAWDHAAQQTFLRSCFRDAPPPEIWEALCAYLAQLPADALLESVQGLRVLDLTPYLGSVRAATLIAHGMADTRRRVEDAEALATAIPHATLQWLPGGHTPMVDCPDDYNAAIQVLLHSIHSN